MDEKIYQDLQKIIDTRKLDAAKEDLKGWKSLNERNGQPEEGHPDYKPRISCRLFNGVSSRDRSCQTRELGECIFYCCLNRPSYKEWRRHHNKAHPEDHLIYKVRCNTCKSLQDEETRFMEGCISEFEKKVNKIEMPREPLSTIDSTIEADLDSIFAEEELFEGKKVQRFTNYYERKPKLREKAIEIHGFKCMACGFDFEQKYGERGSKFIEVHHLKPVASLKEETVVDPRTEMSVVCSNCHRMIHRMKDNVLSLEELRKIVR